MRARLSIRSDLASAIGPECDLRVPAPLHPSATLRGRQGAPLRNHVGVAFQTGGLMEGAIGFPATLSGCAARCWAAIVGLSFAGFPSGGSPRPTVQDGADRAGQDKAVNIRAASRS